MGKLIKCSGCGVEISKKASACPHCGEPLKKGTSLFTWLVLILFILGVFGILPSNKNDSPVNTTAIVAPILKKPVKENLINKKQIQDEDIKYFKQSKEIIIEDINLKIKNKKYKEVMKITAKYLSINGKDNDIIKLNTKARELLIQDNKEKKAKHLAINLAKTKIENQKIEKEILEKLKKIPSSNFNTNLKLYNRLLSYSPDNKKYKTKVEFYKSKIKIENQKIEKDRLDRLANFGKQPIASAWDGSYLVVEMYLKKIAKDPESLKIASCTNVMHSKNGWIVGCTWRARNGFGGMSLQSNWFTIRHNTVIKMDKSSAYSY